MTRKKSRILGEVLDAAKDLHEAGTIDIVTMREFDALCLPRATNYSAAERLLAASDAAGKMNRTRHRRLSHKARRPK
jgi:putative transcriptional regulator